MEHNLWTKLVTLLVILLLLLAAIYRLITVRCIRRQNLSPPNHVHHQQSRHQDTDSLENSFVLLLPIHKHQKVSRVDSKGREGDNDSTCSICLCEFEEDEEIRTIPECLHSFHVPCIDMWLHTHLTCPVCRVDAASSSHISFQMLDSDSDMEVRRQASNLV